MWEDWVLKLFIGAVLGLAVWAFKNWIAEKLKQRKPDDQVITQGDLNNWWKPKEVLFCGKIKEIRTHCATCIDQCNKKRDEARDREMNHLKELIGNDLARGRELFKQIDGKQDQQGAEISKLSSAIQLLAQKIEDHFPKNIMGPHIPS